MSANQPPAQSPQMLDREQLLKMAIGTAKQGNKQAARMMFQQVLAGDPRNERALMWMAQLADTKAERIEWLNRVLVVNPLNEQASAALRKMQYTSSARENRVLLIFGVIVGVLIVLTVVVTFVLLLR